MTFKNSYILPAVICTVLLQAGCSSDDDPVTTDNNNSGEETDSDSGGEETDPDSGGEETEQPGTGGEAGDVLGNFDSSLFGDSLISAGEESCTLDDGTETTCMSLVFAANGAGEIEGNGTIGPYCPESLTTPRSEAGFGSYDGPTTPGFQPLLDAAIAMDADGYDIVDENGNINSDDLTGAAVDGLSYCLQPPLASDIELTFLIPITPEFRAEAFQIGTIDSVGVGVLGVPYKGNPPSVTVVEAGIGGTGSGNIPSLDHCGGHPDPSGYYHWHLIPQGANTVLGSDTYNYTQDHGISCSNSNLAVDESSSFAGLAKDGFPLYGPFDSVDGVDASPMDVATVDACNGHNHATDEFPDGVYHYHAQDDSAPNLPSCLMGKFVTNDVVINGVAGGGDGGGGGNGGGGGGGGGGGAGGPGGQ